MNSLIIRNGTVIHIDAIIKQDILIQNGMISQLGQNILNPGDLPEYEALYKFILPGGIDPHVHMELPTPAGPSCDDFKSGSIAALAGGTTTLIDFVTPQKGESYITAFDKRLAEAQKCHIDYSFHMSPTWFGKSSGFEIEKCIKELGISSFKTYLAYRKNVGISDLELLNVMKEVAHFGGIVTVHCENGELIEFLATQFIENGMTQARYHAASRPEQTESEAVNRVIKFAEIAECPVYIVHVSSDEALDLIFRAQKKGLRVMAETCPHYLVLDDCVYARDDFEPAKYVLSPPIRSKRHQKALWKGIQKGTISTIGTDHCPFNFSTQKIAGIDNFMLIPNGGGGIENRLELLYTYGVIKKKISLNHLVQLFSSKPAQIFGLDTCKGAVKPGLDADLVIFDPKPTQKINVKKQYQNCDYSLYEGIKTRGRTEAVVKSGEIVFLADKGLIINSKGKFLKRKSNFYNA